METKKKMEKNNKNISHNVITQTNNTNNVAIVCYDTN